MYTIATLTTIFTAALAAPRRLAARQNAYTSYRGDGSVAAGWPAIDTWSSFDDIWNRYTDIITNSCAEYGQALNSAEETQQVRDAITSIASEAGVDDRFVLTVVIQESRGCVRVPSTAGAVRNPGLMQSFNGIGSCNDGGVVQNPCPQETIVQMIRDGTIGANAGDNSLQSALAQTSGNSEPAQAVYRAARIYNTGSITDPNDLSNVAAGTASYSSDIANRLTNTQPFTGSPFA